MLTTDPIPEEKDVHVEAEDHSEAPRRSHRIHASQALLNRLNAAFIYVGGGLMLATAIVLLYLYYPLAGLAVFAITFATLSSFYPALAMGIILALTPIQNDLGEGGSPVRFAPAELAMCLTIPALLIKTRGRLILGPTLIPTFFYLAVCVVASLGSVRATTIVSMSQMVLYLVIAVIVFSNLEPRLNRVTNVFDLYILSAAVMAILGVATSFTFLGTNKNGWGSSLGAALIVAVESWFRAATALRRRAITTAMIIIGGALVMTVSRGGWMTALVGITILCVVRRQMGALLRMLLLFGFVAAAAWHFLPQETKDYAFGFDAHRENIRLRFASIDYAMEFYKRDPVIGTGVGLRKEYDATNIVLLTLAESGWAGLITFAAVHVSVLLMMLRVVRQARPQGPAFGFATLSAALIFGRLTHGLVDHYWSRGPITCAWAAVGLATLAYTSVSQAAAVGKRI